MSVVGAAAAAAAEAYINNNYETRLLVRCTDMGFTPLHYACDEGYDLTTIRRLATACPAALEERSLFGELTPIDLIMKKRGDDLDESEDLSVSQVAACLIHHYQGTTLRLKAEYTLCSLGPTVTAALGSSATIEILDLTRVHLTKEGLLTFLEHVAAAGKVLKDLSLNFFEDIDHETCAALSDMLQKNKTLIHLALRTRLLDVKTRNMLQSALIEGMEGNDSLQQLDLNLVPQYKLYLIMGAPEPQSTHQIDRTDIENKLAHNNNRLSDLSI